MENQYTVLTSTEIREVVPIKIKYKIIFDGTDERIEIRRVSIFGVKIEYSKLSKGIDSIGHQELLSICLEHYKKLKPTYQGS